MKTLNGIGASTGIAVGPLYHFNNTARQLTPSLSTDTDAECRRFDAARRRAIERLGELYQKACVTIGPEKSVILQIHQLLLEDIDYVDTVNELICSTHYTAEYAAQHAGERLARVFSEMDDAYMKERAADILDISNRIVRLLCGETSTDLPQVQGQMILAANDLLPSETIQIDREKVLAFITSGGSKMSHSAILARTMGIPVVVGLGECLHAIENGTIVLVDGFTGTVIADPDESLLPQKSFA